MRPGSEGERRRERNQGPLYAQLSQATSVSSKTKEWDSPASESQHHPWGPGLDQASVQSV